MRSAMRSARYSARRRHAPLSGAIVLLLGMLLALVPFLVLLVHGLWLAFGVWLLITPLCAAVVVLSAVVSSALLEDVRTRKLHRLEAQHRFALAERTELAELEAAAGVALQTEGTCTRCGSELLAGARYCSHCRAEVVSPSHPRICGTCATRNLNQAVYCASCGEPFSTPPVVL